MSQERENRFHRPFWWVTAALLLILLTGAEPSANARKKWRYSLEPPVTLDFDMEDIPEPTERETSFYYDFLYSTFALQIKEGLDFPRTFRKVAGRPKQAYNVNVLGEVPDSSWFTNRNADKRILFEEIAQGSNRGSGPAPGPWAVIRGKTEGISPGFLIKDAHGDVYQLKFDPIDYPEISSAAEVIASKFYHAAGYNVKENYIVDFPPDRLVMDSEAEMADEYGRSRRMTNADVEGILGLVARRADGRFRAVAGLYLAGVAKGPFSFEGVRKDDPNDWIPHEHRRDLRGLRILCSWMNENDMREGNTLDMYVEEDGRRFLRHYLLDFGSSLGSETSHPNPDRIGSEYQLDAAEIAKSAFSFGLYRRPWTGRSAKGERPGVGFLESDLFDPGRWKANYPILAFENMTKRDAFWGTKLVVSFSDQQIRAAVETGAFTDPGATEWLTRVLIERRDKIGRYWLARVNPLDRFMVTERGDDQWELRFVDLEVEHGYAEGLSRRYRYSIRAESHPQRPLRRETVPEPVIPLGDLKDGDSDGRGTKVFQVTLDTLLASGKRQGKKINVYLAQIPGRSGLAIVGIERTD